MAQAEDPKWGASDTGRVRDRKTQAWHLLSPEPSPPSLFESLDAPQATLGLPPIAMLQPGRTPSLQGAELIRLVKTVP